MGELGLALAVSPCISSFFARVYVHFTGNCAQRHFSVSLNPIMALTVRSMNEKTKLRAEQLVKWEVVEVS